MYVPPSYTDWLQPINLTFFNIAMDKLNDRFQNWYAKSKRHKGWQNWKTKLQWFEKTRIAEAVGYTFQSVCDTVKGDYRYMYFVHKLFSFPKGISNWCVLFLLWHFKSYLAVCILVWILIFYNSFCIFNREIKTLPLCEFGFIYSVP